MGTGRLSPSLEDYLEAIYGISREKGAVRAKEISRRLGVKGASVTGALRSLARRKLVNYTPYELVTLTPEGRRAAKDVAARHAVLRHFFVHVLGVDERSANMSACQMEHAVSPLILERLTRFVDFIRVCPRAGATWRDAFGHFCEGPGVPESCERCIAACLEAVRAKREENERANGK